jgi:hypothetical protein
MNVSPASHHDRGYELLLEHCAALTRDGSRRAPAFERLEHALGEELARLLLMALARRRANGTVA